MVSMRTVQFGTSSTRLSSKWMRARSPDGVSPPGLSFQATISLSFAMGVKAFRAALVLAILLGSVIVARAAEPNATKELSLTVAAEKKTYQVGDAIVLILTIKNTTDHDLTICDGTDLYRSWFHELEFADDSGKPIAFTAPEESLKDAVLACRRLHAGEQLHHKVLLNGWKLAGLGHSYTAIGKEPRTVAVTGTYRTPVGLDLKQSDVWLGRISAKPVTLSVVQPSEKARDIVAQLRPNLRTFALYLTYVPEQREERPNLELYAPPIVIRGNSDQFHITDDQCTKIFDWLVEDGFFDRAEQVVAEKGRGLPVGPYYDLTISVGSPLPMYHASIGWDKKTVARLKAIRERLDGSPANAIKQLIKAVKADAAASSDKPPSWRSLAA